MESLTKIKMKSSEELKHRLDLIQNNQEVYISGDDADYVITQSLNSEDAKDVNEILKMPIDKDE